MTAMVNLKVMNGTPVAGPHLCRTCVWGQYTTGYRESDLFVVCANFSPAFVVPFVVRECTDYQDRHRPSWEQMEKLAISFNPNVRPKPTPGFRGAGFATVPVVEEDEDEHGHEHEDELEEVARS